MERCCNCTNEWDIKCIPSVAHLISGVLSVALAVSLCWNIYCCASKYCSGNQTCRRKRRSPRQSARQMEENPIYGNLSYTTSAALFTESDLPHSSLSSASVRDPQRVNSDSQPKSQDCYANLTLKAPRLQSGRSSPQIQLSDVVHLEESPESDKEEDSSTDILSTVSELYASVQTRAKTLDTADIDEGYANHL
ncbi:signaling threshold-regulating transmembrane adapter 1-like [Mugil cephalus]|uniref:signaling threshold-regulating transmembrane adapter 1-like n=1 Tax=Mugil cephalus TaxID=48193 RepID=UPI001FB6204F|nr:signaling threshold-regulating transmembrane adapter 1-like [Mugil cephalus]